MIKSLVIRNFSLPVDKNQYTSIVVNRLNDKYYFATFDFFTRSVYFIDIL